METYKCWQITERLQPLPRAAEAGGIVGHLAYGDITYAANHGNVSAPFKDDDMYSYLRGVAVGGIVGKDIV